jgi:hypothetical protein
MLTSVRKPTIPTKFGVRNPPQLEASRHRAGLSLAPLNVLAVMISQGRDGGAKAAREGLVLPAPTREHAPAVAPRGGNQTFYSVLFVAYPNERDLQLQTRRLLCKAGT